MDIFSLFGSIVVENAAANKAIDDTTAKAEGSSAKMGTAFGKVGTLLKGAIVGGAAAAGAALVGLGAAGFQGAADLQQATAQMKQGLNLTETEAKKLERAALDVFKNGFGDNITDAVNKVGTLRQQLGDMSQQDASRLTQMAATIADVYGEDYARVVNNAAVLTQQFGISNEQAFDMIALGFQRGLNSSGDFLDSIGEYSTQLSNGGATAEQFFSLMETGLQGGVLGTDKAADAFKEFRLRISDGSTATADGLALIGINADEMARKLANGTMTSAEAFDLVLGKLRNTDDQTIRMQAGAALLGTQYEDLGDKAVNALSLSATKMDDMAGATDTAMQKYDNFKDNLTTLWRTLNTEIIKAIAPIMPKVNELVTGVTANMPQIIGAVSGVVERFSTFAAPIVTAIDEVIGGLRESSPEIRQTLTGIADMVRGWGPQLEPYITAVIKLFKGIVNALTVVWAGIRTAWQNGGKEMLLVIAGDFKLLATTLKGIVEAIGKVLQGDWAGAWEVVKRTVTDLRSIWADMERIFNAGFDKIEAVIQGAMPRIMRMAGDIKDAFIEQIKELPAALAGLGKDIVDGLVGGIKDNLNRATEGAKALGEGVQNRLNNIFRRHSPSRWMYDLGTDLVAGLSGGITDPGAVQQLQASAEALGSQVGDALLTTLGIKNQHAEWYEAGQGVISKFVAGMQQQMPYLEQFYERMRNARPDVAIPLPNASAQVAPAAALPMPAAESIVAPLRSIAVQAGAILVQAANTFTAAATWTGNTLAAAGNWGAGILTGSSQVWQATLAWAGNALGATTQFLGDVVAQTAGAMWGLAQQQIPWLGAMMQGLAGGPVAMLAQLFSYLIGESAEWGAIVRLITEMAKPLIGAFNELLRALWPVIQIVLGVLRSAFGTLASIVGGVVAPVFKAVAGVIASVWNAFARAINWALGWLGVNLPTINAGGGGSASGTVFANSAAATVLGGKGKATQGLPGGLGGGTKGLGGKGTKGLPTGLGGGIKGMSKLTGLKTPKMSTGAGKAMGKELGKGIAKGGGVKMPKPKGAGKGGGGAPKMPKGNAPKPPKISSPKPTDIKTPDSNMGGGTKVSEITGPTRDLFLDLLSPLAALPELIGIGNRMVDLLAGGATLSPVAIAAPGIGGRIENLTINLPPSPVPYDARRIALEIQPYLGRAHKTSVRGRGGK